MLANQFPRQILHVGANGPQVYDSVMANARSKVVFETRGEENLRPLALDLFMGVMDPKKILHKLYSTKVIDYVEETRIVRSTSESWSDAEGMFTGTTGTDMAGGAMRGGAEQAARVWSKTHADSDGTSRMHVEGGSSSESEVPFLRPVMGKELSSIIPDTIENQVFRAMAVLHDQKQRHALARLVGKHRPETIATPTIEKTPADAKMEKSFLTRVLKKLPYALPSAKADMLIKDRDRKITAGLLKNVNEPTAIKRKIVENADEPVKKKRKIQ